MLTSATKDQNQQVNSQVAVMSTTEGEDQNGQVNSKVAGMSTTEVEECHRGYKVFNDSVHGHIKIHPLCIKIIDTPEFQRLRNLKQLGSTYFVYPGASHNRFEHSLGVCHLAGEMIEALIQNDVNLGINSTDKLCVQIAGLCHDIGHGPFSHLWERFLERKGVKWHHENQSVNMFEHLIEKNELIKEFEKHGLDKTKRNFIKELILGEGKNCDENKQFLFQIVCNKTNSIDVDKWDYFLRDSLHLNLSVNFDYRRLLQFCKVLKKEDEGGNKKMHIVFRNKESYNIYEMFLVRSSLHYRAYQHRVALAINRMILDALCAADEFYSLKLDDNCGLKLSEAHTNLDVWTRLTDNIFYDILWSHSKYLDPAQKILKCILCRHLYKFIASKKVVPPTDFVKKKPNWPNELTEDLENVLNSKWKYGDKQLEFVIGNSSFYFGSGVPDPFKSIYFYDKRNPEKIEEKDWSEIALYPGNSGADTAHFFEIHIFCKSADLNDNLVSEVRSCADVCIESFFKLN